MLFVHCTKCSVNFIRLRSLCIDQCAVCSVKGAFCVRCIVEEMSMRWMDRPSVVEMEREGVYEMDGWEKWQQNGNATEMDKM